ncbi:MAG: class I SAM-dependent methyltransferase [Solirubrobacteraceae bacterium]
MPIVSAPEQRIRHPVFARLYARCSAGGEARGVAEHRRRLLAGLHGRVLELGAGSGLNFAHYPATVSEVVAVEPEPYLRGCAVGAAEQAPVTVTVIEAAAARLPFSDASFDAAVTSLVLCSVAEPAGALRELRRVLAPGGSLRYYEHVVSHRPAAARAQCALDATVWPRIAGGCHLARDTGALIRAAGFEVETEERIAVKLSWAQPTIPHLLGSARAG